MLTGWLSLGFGTKRRYAFALSCMAILMLAACGEQVRTEVVEVVIDQTGLEFQVGQQVQLTATLVSTGDPDETVLWTSSDPEVVTVTSEGLATATGVGSADISATSSFDPGKRDSVTVIVTEADAVLSVTIDGGNRELVVGDSLQLTATQEITGKPDLSLTWESDDHGIVVISDRGFIEAVGPGKANVTARSTHDAGRSDTVEITVRAAEADDADEDADEAGADEADEGHADEGGSGETDDSGAADPTPSLVLGVAIDQDDLVLDPGDVVELTATVRAKGHPDLSVLWSSSRTEVASIDSAGRVTALTVGEATIKARSVYDSAQSDTILVTVVQPDNVLSLTIEQSNQELTVGDSVQLGTNIEVEGAPELGVDWESDAPDVATVAPDGTVTAVGVGTARISASSVHDPTKLDSVVVEVFPPTDPAQLYLSSFSLGADLNAPNLRTTVDAKVESNTIRVLLSAGTDVSSLVASFVTGAGDLFVNGDRQVSGVTPNDFGSSLQYVLRSRDGLERTYEVEVTVLDELRNVVPHLYIETEGGAPIDSKEVRVPGTIVIDGMGEYDDYSGQMEIKGRGNSTWAQPKKPYQIKLSSKDSLLGLPSGKKWILLANYFDTTLMGNAIAMKAGRLLGMPFTHHIIPVEVTLNGEFVGSYMLTEHKEVKKNRIDLDSLGSDGVYLEFTVNAKDKYYEFTSDEYELPVVVRYPKLGDTAASDVDTVFGAIMDDFHELEALIAAPDFPENGYRERFDTQSLAQYLLVFFLSANQEINHPKSVFMYRVDGVYHAGPLWDFDWAWGYTSAQKMHFVSPTRPTFLEGRLGATFFGRLMEDPVFLTQLETEWLEFKRSLYPQLVSYMEGYVQVIEESFRRDYEVWHQGASEIAGDAERMFDWLDKRVDYIDTYVFSLANGL